VSPTTRLKVVGVGYEKAEFVIAQPVIPDAPKTRAWRPVSGMLIDELDISKSLIKLVIQEIVNV
jgi:Tfp pilus assembly PilM family ATPase